MIKCYLHATVENQWGWRYRCISWGKDWVKKDDSEQKEYTEVFKWVQYNTEEEPKFFEITNPKFVEAVEAGKLKFIYT